MALSLQDIVERFRWQTARHKLMGPFAGIDLSAARPFSSPIAGQHLTASSDTIPIHHSLVWFPKMIPLLDLFGICQWQSRIALGSCRTLAINFGGGHGKPHRQLFRLNCTTTSWCLILRWSSLSPPMGRLVQALVSLVLRHAYLSLVSFQELSSQAIGRRRGCVLTCEDTAAVKVRTNYGAPTV